MKPLLLPFLLFTALATPLPALRAESQTPSAQAENAAPEKAAEEAELAALKAAIAKLNPQKGEILLHNGLARIALPEGFYFLNERDSRTILVDFWGNPPQTAEGVLGMIVQSPETLFTEEGWGVIVTYSDDGHIDDSDAAKIDYAALLKEMKADTLKGSKERVKNGYESIELVGWAEPPHYDAATHKIYWAKELAFGGNPAHTLNYCIRILGRRGVLELNTVAPVSLLAEVREHSATLLGNVEFTEGNRYADFNSTTDRVASYGIAALVAGGLAGKMGLFKTLLAALIAGKKFVVIGVIGIASLISKWFKRNKE